jgi:hypothetical protein
MAAPALGLAPVLAQQLAATLEPLHQPRPELCVAFTGGKRRLLGRIPIDTLVLERGALQQGEAAASVAY